MKNTKDQILFDDVKIKVESALKTGSDTSETDRMLKYITKSYVLEEASGRPNQKIACTQCGKDFKKTSNALDHVRIHFRSRPFRCQKCGKGFT